LLLYTVYNNQGVRSRVYTCYDMSYIVLPLSERRPLCCIDYYAAHVRTFADT